ncbi:iron-containing alcohol dehydrogenase [Planctomicrobium sp.]|jgi:alcohol dehydrogenase class IV|nr:iron-containing alcohol dehydrogenase [Planctomicrobium sp.]MDA7527421.1 iron-containing alcohol dehydrogenase [bacterium]MDB4743413.1 iron-containing alcohol dehydrogenase [Planctomicrobium sp.]
MTIQFQFLSPGKVLFGCGQRKLLGGIARDLGQRAVLVSGSRTLQSSSDWTDILADLNDSDVEMVCQIECRREPTIADVDSAVKSISSSTAGVDLIIGIGGGAALDLAKALSAMLTNRHGNSVRGFLEGVGSGLEITQPPLPMIAVPTTAGTGSEATKNAVISVDDPPCKKSLRSEKMIPDVVIIDPELTVSVSPQVTAESGMDAITQLIESYISNRSTPLTQALCNEGLKHAIPNIERAYRDGTNIEARSAMSYAAYLSGVALANSGLGMAHGVAAALGAICDVPHGLACATLLPIALRTNQNSSRKEQVVLGKLFVKNPHLSKSDAIDASINHIQQLCDSLSIPRTLSEIGVKKSDVLSIVSGSRGNSMNGNPRQLSDTELMQILEENL